tara:strand:+ start:163 stop:483 length:321 start_codon:yes stop_codon:yes gene_type:complete
MATKTWILDGVKELNENQKVLFFIQYERERKSVSIGVLLAKFLRFAGIQKFYLGDLKAGVLLILFAITLIALILSLLDAANMGNLVYDYNCCAAERIIDDIKYLRK